MAAYVARQNGALAGLDDVAVLDGRVFFAEAGDLT
jgi:hypothetical protein